MKELTLFIKMHKSNLVKKLSMIFIKDKLQSNTEKECIVVHNCDILNVYKKKESYTQ